MPVTAIASPETPVHRPTWPLALPVTAAAVAVGAPVFGASFTDRAARLILGDLFPGGQELVLALVLLAAARGLLRHRRIAYHLVLTLSALSALDALAAREFARLALLTAAAAVLIRHRGDFTTSSGRARTAMRTGALVYGLAIAYGLVVLLAERHHVSPYLTPVDAGQEILGGLTASGSYPLHFDGSADHWFEASLGIIGGGGLLAMLITMLAPAPPPPAGTDEERAEAARLVDHDGSDTLAPFVLRGDKSYVFSPDRRAVIGYRVLFGVAAAGGDPAGDPGSYSEAVAEFVAAARRSGWRIAVLGTRADRIDLWRPYGLHGIGIGDEVLLSPATFGLGGRSMRNVRQAVQRTYNAGVTTDVVTEGELAECDRTRMRTLATEAMGGIRERGFSMNLDGLLTGRHTTPVLVVTRDAGGTPVGFQRYLPSAYGRRLSLDAMRRAPGSPNGLNERMIADIVEYARDHGVQEVSLNFAAFRELFETADRGPLQQGAYRLIHLLDRFVKVESLYLFNRKFRPSYVPRGVLFGSWVGIVPVAAALLTLEFGHRRPVPAADARPEPRTDDSYTTWPTTPGW